MTQVRATVSKRAVAISPFALWFPNEILRQITACRRARSAARRDLAQDLVWEPERERGNRHRPFAHRRPDLRHAAPQRDGVPLRLREPPPRRSASPLTPP